MPKAKGKPALPEGWPTKPRVMTHFPCSESAVAVQIIDARNAPSYLKGDAIVVDPEVAAKSGDMVVAVIYDAPILGKYARRGSKIQLLSLNRKWPSCTLEKKRGDRIVGVVTEHVRPRAPERVS